jgi:hypothetical protein
MPSCKAFTATDGMAMGAARAYARKHLCPDAGTGVHEWLKQLAGACKKCACSADEAAQIISEQSITRPLQHREVENILTFVFRQAGSEQVKQKPESPKYNPAVLAREVSGLPRITREWLVDHSPLPTDSLDTFMRTVRQPGESAAIVMSHFNRDGEVGKHFAASWAHDAAADFLDEFKYKHRNQFHGVHWCAQPYNGGESWAQPHITSWRYLVIESDAAAECDWLPFLASLPLPIRAIYTSGGRSIHVLAEIPCCSKEDWDSLVWHEEWLGTGRTLAQWLIERGADKACLTAVRLTRLPFCYRPEKQGWQDLLWLDDQPSAAGIFKKEPQATKPEVQHLC